MKKLLFVIFLIVFWAVSSIFLDKYLVKVEEHNKLHEEIGYETLGVLQTANRYGEPRFYKVVRYQDGCEDNIRISGEEYFIKQLTYKEE